MAVYAVGDIQGCFKPLKKLLKKVKFDPAKDRLWVVGDMVNRGPDSLKVLRFLKELGDAAVCVLGNHDLHLLNNVAGGELYRRDTLDEVLAAPDLEELVDWLRSRPLMHADPELGWCMVHGGLHPGWTVKKAMKRARKVEKRLRGNDWREFCRQLHHQKFPTREPPKKHPDRRLFAAAVLTRSRYCTQSGKFNWEVRSGASSSKRERPWYTHPRLAWRGAYNVVFGHWAARGLVADQPHVLGLDSGYVWGGSMTLARLRSRGRCKIVAQVSAS